MTLIVIREAAVDAALDRRAIAQEELLAALNARTSDLALLQDADTRLLYASPALRHLFGYGPEDVVGLVGLNFVHPDDREAVQQLNGQVVADGRTSGQRSTARSGVEPSASEPR